MKVNTRVQGADQVVVNLRGMNAKMNAAIVAGLEEAGQAVASEAQRLVQDPPKTGRIYTTRFWTDSQGRVRPGAARTPHQASAPHEAPATDMGNLVSLIVVDQVNPADLSITIESQAEYSRFLEYGTRKMAPRPYMRRALQSMQARILAIFMAKVKTVT